MSLNTAAEWLELVLCD